MAAFHLSLSEFKQSGQSYHDEFQISSHPDPKDEDYAKSLIFSLQTNLQDLKNEANGLKNITFRETAGSNIQTFRAQEKIIDYRKNPVNKPQGNVKRESLVKPSNNSPKDAKLDYPSYGRGIDPLPDLDFGYMTRKSGKTAVAPLKKVIYEKNFEKFLMDKQAKGVLPEADRPFMWEEPRIIKFLREEFLRLTKRTENKLMKAALVNELVSNLQFGELFGVTEEININLVNEIVANIGTMDFVNIDEFLQFYQVSKNNLLKSKQIFFDQQAKSVQSPNLKLKLEFLLNKFVFSTNEKATKADFINALQDSLQTDILEILQIPPILYESLPEFLQALSKSSQDLTFDLLHSLFDPPEVIDFILPNEIILLAQSVFISQDSPPSGQVTTFDFISTLRSQPLIEENLFIEARSPQGLPSLPAETLEELLDRILKEAPDWLTWEEFVRYFSIEGRPTEDSPVTTTDCKPPLGFRYKITVPAPFNFMRRDSIKQPSIRERRLKEMLKEKDEIVDKELMNKFKSKPVPPEVKIPLFEIIMKEQEQKSRVLKSQYEALTKSLERPFSFYYRDLAKPEVKQQDVIVQMFHANPVPWFCKIDKRDQMEQQEELRKDRILKMAKHSLSLSKMPPRMEIAMKEIKEKTRTETGFKPIPFRANEVPNFSALQESFSRTLEEKKQGFVPTVPVPFEFHEGHKSKEVKVKIESSPKKNWRTKSNKAKRALSAFDKPKFVSATTEKTEAMNNSKKEYLLKQKEKQEKKQEEEEMRKIKHEAMKRAMKKAGTIKKYDLSAVYDEKIKERKEEMRQYEKEYKMKLQEITEKVANRPFLIEQVVSSNLSRDIQGMGPVRRMLNQEYISEAVTSQEQEVSSESFGE